ncbi:MAPEG family protein [Microvirga antarctica]|uniref:MAPEG family protein n=1 Tax=Microvirga antarctica TaxID=2819233 RepID=UPI001B3092A9|nr:MAPEG family protein [Microvirga antarctica]
MTITAILLPVFVQVALIFVLMIGMGRSRIGHLRRGDVAIGEIALNNGSWPTRTQQISNAYGNQFELPVLFLILVALAIITRKADLVFVVMSWIFVVTRLVHAFVHVTSNKVQQRFMVFLIGALILALMWIMFAMRIIAAEAGI